jgi:hypothetical protein
VTNSLVQGGLSISNIIYSGSIASSTTSQFGSFSNASNAYLGLTSGIVLATGYVDHIAAAGNSNGNMSDQVNAAAEDADLAAAAGLPVTDIYDASILEFDFVPTGNTLSFTYVFGSEEYPNWVCSRFDDVFGFFLSGYGINGTYSNNAVNIALIPNTTHPVSVNTINDGINGGKSADTCVICNTYGLSSPQYYVNNLADPNIVFGGMTKVLTAKYNVTPCKTYHIKLAIGDLGNGKYDSGVFLGANSFTTNAYTIQTSSTNTSITNNAIYNCTNGVFTFTLPSPASSPVTINYTIGGTAINGTDYTHITDSVIIPTGQDTVTVKIQPTNNNSSGTVIISALSSCSPISDTIKILPYIPMIPVTTGATTICPGKSANIGINNSEGVTPYTYNWSNSLGTGTSYNVMPPNTTTYTVTVTDKCNQTATDNVTIDVASNPSPTIVGPSSICTGNTATLDAGSGYSTYLWSNNATTQTTTINTADTYTVTVSNSSGCTGSTLITITVNANLVPTITGPSAICAGNTATLDAGSGYSTYLWSNNATTQSTTVNTTGTYSVTVSNASGCTGTGSAIFTVNSNPSPVITGPSSICSGNTGTLDAGSGYSSYLWSNNATTQSTTVNTTGTYSVTVSNSSGCTGTTSAVFTVNSNPIPTISGPSSICSGNSATLDAGSGYSSYLWSNNATTQSISVNATGTYLVTVSNSSGCTGTTSAVFIVNSNPIPTISGPSSICSGNSATLDAGSGYSSYLWSNNATSQTISVNTTGTFTVTVSNNSGCTGTSSAVFTVNSNPTPSITGPSSICSGNTATLDAGSGYSSYSWSNNANSQTISASTSGTYAVTVTNGNGCSATTQTLLTVNNNPSATASGNTPCEGQALNLSSGGGTTYIWAGPNSFSSTVQNPTVSGVVLSDAGTYLVTVTNANGCSSTAQATISINTNPTATASGNTPCAGQTLNLNSGGGTSYNWAGPNSFSSTVQNPVISGVSTSAAGTYTVTVTNSQGCSDTKTIMVNINALPIVSIMVPENNFCKSANSVTLKGTPPGGNFSGKGIINDSIFNPALDSTGQYELVYSYTDANSCPNSDSELISVIPIPTVSVQNGIAASMQIYTGEVVTITATPANYPNYDFYIGSNLVQSGASNTYQSNTFINGNIVVVYASDGGCIAADSITLDIKPFPNAFIPSGSDDDNKVFLKGLNLQIFNRWDQLLYSGIEGWTGEYNGKLVSPGTYFYVVNLQGLNNSTIILKGSVTLVAPRE